MHQDDGKHQVYFLKNDGILCDNLKLTTIFCQNLSVLSKAVW